MVEARAPGAVGESPHEAKLTTALKISTMPRTRTIGWGFTPFPSSLFSIPGVLFKKFGAIVHDGRNPSELAGAVLYGSVPEPLGGGDSVLSSGIEPDHASLLK